MTLYIQYRLFSTAENPTTNMLSLICRPKSALVISPEEFRTALVCKFTSLRIAMSTSRPVCGFTDHKLLCWQIDQIPCGMQTCSSRLGEPQQRWNIAEGIVSKGTPEARML